MKARAVLWWLPAALAIVVFVAPLATGERTLILRDVLNTHLGLRAHLAEALRQGELPIVDPLRAGGQGLIGNPNAVPLYPDNLLLLVASTLWQLNAHFWLHWLIALPAAYWLARRWGLEREGAGAAGAVYALSGYFVSQLSLYNAVAIVALAPALAAALLAACEDSRRARPVAAAAGLWALSLLGGDPLLAVLTLATVIALVAWRVERIRWWRWAVALGAGSLIAAPQLVELLRLLPASFRGYWGQDPASQLRAAPEPLALFDALVPFFFGRPDLNQSWGNSYFGGTPPLYFSVAPGMLALVWMRCGLDWRRRADRVLPVVLFVSLLLTYGSPWVVPLLTRLPGSGLFRFPMKFLVGAGLAGTLVVGRGVDRMLASDEGASLFRRTAALAAALQLALLSNFLAFGHALEGGFRSVLARGVTDDVLPMLRFGWAATAAIQLLALVAAIAASHGLRRRPALACVMLATIHAASQLYLMRPMLPTDDAATYAQPPPLIARLPESDVLVHGEYMDSFGRFPTRRIERPDQRLVWLQRRAQAELFSFPGLMAGRRYEFNFSPEGLDSFLVHSLVVGMRNFDDAARLRVLAATGADLVLVPRPLDSMTEGLADLLFEIEGTPPLRIYRVVDPIGDAQLLGSVRFAPHIQAALDRIAESDFEPRRDVVVAGSAAPRSGPSGTARVVRFDADEIVVDVDSSAGGVVLARRSWLPIWRATIDGESAPVLVGNMTRLAIEAAPGHHRVRFFVSRVPLAVALAIASMTLVALAAAVWRERQP